MGGRVGWVHGQMVSGQDGWMVRHFDIHPQSYSFYTPDESRSYYGMACVVRPSVR